MELNQELNTTILDFEAIQTELNYKRAQDALRDLMVNLDLTPQEQTGLEPEIRGLITMMDKLERSVVHIAAFGMVGRGKSSVLNALLGQNAFATGPLHGVTQAIHTADWQICQEDFQGREIQGQNSTSAPVWRLTLTGAGNSQIQLTDTPGIDEINGEQREQLAREMAKQVDLILFVISGDMTKVEHEALSELRLASKPILLVFNKIDQYPDADRQAIYEKIRDDRVKELVSPEEIVMAAAAPLIPVATRQSDGSFKMRLDQGTPWVDDLKLKILEILEREGKALIALNSMLYADTVNEQILQRKLHIRDRSANQTIWNAVITKAVAVALNPVTVVDLLSGAAIDVVMILTLSRLFGIPMTEQGAVGLLQKIALSMGGISASELLANLGLSSLKGLLGLSAPATGGASLLPYLSVAMTQASVAGVSCYAIGQITKTYLAQGASWGPDGPKAVVNEILENLDEASILNRIKQELRNRLGQEI